ncbi:MAG: MBL fold metallo-hydrolase [Candidatus Riflebacteria bacterium]|nr:MBL fold metallo-hydrolase [Candidatus Riflebacteria bacterium]
MKIKVWGCRGSLPSPGPQTLRYGGNTTCLEIRSDQGAILVIDAGSGMRPLGNALLKEPASKEIFFFLTHCHWDHLAGFPFFIPAYSDRFTLHVYGGPKNQRSVKNILAHQLEPPYFPVDFSNMRAKFVFGKDCPRLETVGFHDFDGLRLSHPNGGYGCRLTNQGKTFVFLTDNELGYQHPGGLAREEYLGFCRGADLVLHDAQYTESEIKRTRTWGHTTFFEATDLAIEAGVKRLGLFHHDPDRSDDDLDRQVEFCRQRIKKAKSTVDCFAVAEGQVFDF